PAAAAGLLYAGIYGMMTALSVRIGTAWGAGEERRIPLILRNGLILGTMVGVAAAALMGDMWPLLTYLHQPPEVIAAMGGYWACIALYMIPYAVLTAFTSAFEAVDRPWTGTAFAFVGVGLNVPLNYILIYGFWPIPPLGLTGAGIAALLAESTALVAALLYWRSAWSTRRLRLRREVDGIELVEAVREGAPLGLLYLVETGSVTAATMLVGAFGTIALAGNEVAMSVGGVLYMVPMGIAGAVAIKVAQAKGEGDPQALRRIALAALSLVTGWLTAAAIGLFLFGHALASLIASDAEVIEVAAQIFKVFALFQIMDGVQSTALGALRGMSDTRWPALVSFIAYWVISLPLGWVLAHFGGLGPAGIWAGFFLGLLFAAVALVRRFRTKTRALLAEAARA
ncbi:MAG: MATE family efflux transporter, partial [Rhodobacteraceae bacterium]|nr:MATE family efflux transporter [Paracoccaceae bacterium]